MSNNSDQPPQVLPPPPNLVEVEVEPPVVNPANTDDGSETEAEGGWPGDIDDNSSVATDELLLQIFDEVEMEENLQAQQNN